MSLFFLLIGLVTSVYAQSICQNLCDGDDHSLVTEPYLADSITTRGRVLSLFVSDKDNVAYGQLETSFSADVMYLERSFDGANSWTMNNTGKPFTPILNFDGDIENGQIGVIKACLKLNASIDCTHWSRSKVRADNSRKAAFTALMAMYNVENGLWNGVGWWNSANCLVSAINSLSIGYDYSYKFVVEKTFNINVNKYMGNFTSENLEETAWWGLAWINAAYVQGDAIYLETSRIIADYLASFVDDQCGGGLVNTIERTNKTSITNAMYVKLNAALASKLKELGDENYKTYFQRALDTWTWLNSSALIGKDDMVAYSLNLDTCQSNSGIFYTHVQGMMIGASARIALSYYENENLEEGKLYATRGAVIANALLENKQMTQNGVLNELCEIAENCTSDESAYKGIFIRNLVEIVYTAATSEIDTKKFIDFIGLNSESLYQTRNTIDQYGLHYSGKLVNISANSQASALDTLYVGVVGKKLK